MRDLIRSNINSPGQLEKLYRSNKTLFKSEFNRNYGELKGNMIAECWRERLNFESDDISWGSRNELWFVVIASLVAGLFAKLPSLFSIEEDFFYPRNISFLVFPFMAAFFAWKNKLTVHKMALLAGALVVCLVYINILPDSTTSDTLMLACIHLPLLLWVILGVSFAGDGFRDYARHLGFLRFNGDLLVMSALLMIAGGLMSGITINLFSLIGFEIEEFYGEYVIIYGLPSVPIVATFLTQSNPLLVNKVSPVIAKIFSPLVLVMLVIYLGAIIFSGKDPYNDRDFLLLFNLLLIGVIALIFFSIAENSTKDNPIWSRWILFLLAVVTVVVNGIALSAISFRISEWGITPNRVAVLGINVIVLIHLLLASVVLFKSLRRKSAITEVGRLIVLYLPVYFIWTLLVVFIFPLVFGFK
jgi:hypothetical protein